MTIHIMCVQADLDILFIYIAIIEVHLFVIFTI